MSGDSCGTVTGGKLGLGINNFIAIKSPRVYTGITISCIIYFSLVIKPYYYVHCIYFLHNDGILTDSVFFASLRLMSAFLMVIAFIWYQNSKLTENFIITSP